MFNRFRFINFRQKFFPLSLAAAPLRKTKNRSESFRIHRFLQQRWNARFLIGCCRYVIRKGRKSISISTPTTRNVKQKVFPKLLLLFCIPHYEAETFFRAGEREREWRELKEFLPLTAMKRNFHLIVLSDRFMCISVRWSHDDKYIKIFFCPRCDRLFSSFLKLRIDFLTKYCDLIVCRFVVRIYLTMVKL